MSMEQIARDMRLGVFPRKSEQTLLEEDAAKPLRARGVSRLADNEKALLVSFNRAPTDDELRELHEALSVQPLRGRG